MSTAFNQKMQGKVEKFHAGLNQTMSHYVNQYGNDWDDYVDYALRVHRATPHSVTKFSPYYLLHGRDMRLPNTGDLAARVRAPEENSVKQNRVGHHIETLASKLNEAYEVVMKSNKISREKQKVQYDKNTKLRTFVEGDYVYLKEMTVGVGKSKKFRIRWQGPFRITKRYSDLNCQIQLKPGKLVTVNINRLKKCNNPQEKGRLGRKLLRFLRKSKWLMIGTKVMMSHYSYWLDLSLSYPPRIGTKVIVKIPNPLRQSRWTMKYKIMVKLLGPRYRKG
jgi:hypothetical protein